MIRNTFIPHFIHYDTPEPEIEPDEDVTDEDFVDLVVDIAITPPSREQIEDTIKTILTTE